MRQAITLGRRHGKATWEILLGPERPIREHTTRFKARMADRADKTFAEIALWTNSNTRSRKFLSPAQLAKAAAAQETAIAEQAKRLKAKEEPPAPAPPPPAVPAAAE